MVDIENELFTKIATELRFNFANVFVTGEILNAPSQFPCVYILQTNSSLYEKCFDSSEEEAFSQLEFEISAYSNLKTGKKSQCKEIMKCVDTIMRESGFVRVMLNPIPNADTTIYRMVGRYRGIASKDGYIFRR